MTSGSSQNTSTRVQVIANFEGLSQPLVAGSPKKNGAPAISKPATDPKLNETVAPSARLYHSTAVGVSSTANINDMVIPCDEVIYSIPLPLISGANRLGDVEGDGFPVLGFAGGGKHLYGDSRAFLIFDEPCCAFKAIAAKVDTSGYFIADGGGFGCAKFDGVANQFDGRLEQFKR